MNKEDLINTFGSYFNSIIHIARQGDNYSIVGMIGTNMRVMTVNRNLEILSLFSV